MNFLSKTFVDILDMVSPTNYAIQCIAYFDGQFSILYSKIKRIQYSAFNFKPLSKETFPRLLKCVHFAT